MQASLNFTIYIEMSKNLGLEKGMRLLFQGPLFQWTIMYNWNISVCVKGPARVEVE